MKNLFLIVFIFLFGIAQAQIDEEEEALFGDRHGGSCAHYNATLEYQDSTFNLNFEGKQQSGGIRFSYSYQKDSTIKIYIGSQLGSLESYTISSVKDTILQIEFDGLRNGTRKPVIYLYPEEETIVDVKLNFNGKLSNTYPDYGDGWQVVAKPNGDLINKKDNSKHRYLFWDGINNENFEASDFETGFVVKKEETLQFLDSTLTKLGLNDYERNDFITFWMPLMKQNDYNFVHFMINEECDQVAILDVNPKPDSELRVYILYAKTDASQKVKPQILKTTKRTGFTLVEWGGIILNNTNNTKYFFLVF